MTKNTVIIIYSLRTQVNININTVDPITEQELYVSTHM